MDEPAGGIAQNQHSSDYTAIGIALEDGETCFGGGGEHGGK